MLDLKRVVVIYNPNSTGDSPRMARECADELRKALPVMTVDLLATERAGHARELAYQAAKSHPQVLIISVSGDGGYHEVVNGVMQAKQEGADPLCAVLPGGNANDHYSHVYSRPLLEAIHEGEITELDLLKVDLGNEFRYAHSYAGLGITPLVAVELNRHELSVIKERWLALKTFWNFKPFKIEIDGSVQSFDSIIMANIGIMAKHLKLDDSNSPHDGKFEIIQWPHVHKLNLLKQFLLSALGKAKGQRSVSSMQFTTAEAMPMQLDGEVVDLAANLAVTVESAHKALRTIR